MEQVTQRSKKLHAKWRISQNPCMHVLVRRQAKTELAKLATFILQLIPATIEWVTTHTSVIRLSLEGVSLPGIYL
jgi:hypothetical protein